MREDNRLTRISQLILGTACAAVAAYWLIFSIKARKMNASTWATVVFLAGFGSYLVWIGLGYGYRFIEFLEGAIILKKNPLMAAENIKASDIEKLEIYPLKFVICLKSGKKILTRLGVSDVEKIELIKDELLIFAETHNLTSELMNEL